MDLFFSFSNFAPFFRRASFSHDFSTALSRAHILRLKFLEEKKKEERQCTKQLAEQPLFLLHTGTKNLEKPFFQKKQKQLRGHGQLCDACRMRPLCCRLRQPSIVKIGRDEVEETAHSAAPLRVHEGQVRLEPGVCGEKVFFFLVFVFSLSLKPKKPNLTSSSFSLVSSPPNNQPRSGSSAWGPGPRWPTASPP